MKYKCFKLPISHSVPIQECQWGRFINSKGKRFKTSQTNYYKLRKLCIPVESERLGPVSQTTFSIGAKLCT